METNTKSEVLFNNIVYYAFSILAGLFFAFVDALMFSEWWKISIEKDTHNYPFGVAGWTYSTAELYATVCLVDWIVLTSLLALTIWFMIKKQRKWTVLSLLACLVYFFIMYYVATIE